VTLFSYGVRWDHGFAPNPFFGVCTLATCKPTIRKKAKVGDWVLGTGSAARGYQGRAIFLMRITETARYDDYWRNALFVRKRPVMNGSLKQRFGDNIYHHVNGAWIQEDSRHSYDGQPNEDNLRRDTDTTDRVLMGSDFIYWGEAAPMIPQPLQKFVIARPGWAERFTQAEVDRLVNWTESLGQRGHVGNPLEWRFEQRWR